MSEKKRVLRERSHITSAARGRKGVVNADATVILTVYTSVKLLTEGGGGGSEISKILLT